MPAGHADHPGLSQRLISKPDSISLDLKDLRKLIGAGALRSLQMRKSTLKIWRRSSPHNWFVENKHGNMLWHSSEINRHLPRLEMFALVRHSSRRIWTGCPEIVGSDEGACELSIYKLKKRYC